MKAFIAAAAVSLMLGAPAPAEEKRGEKMVPRSPTALSMEEVQSVAPALARFGSEVLVEDLWQRTELSRRDRSIVTVAILIARHQPAELKHYVEVALDNDVTPAEISEIVTHLAFYSGWPGAMAAIVVIKDIFAARDIRGEQLASASPELLALNEAAESQRSTTVAQSFGAISPGLVQFTTNPLFLDLWQRPGLKPRDRSLATVSALIAAGQSAQIGYHLNRAMDNGLSAQEAGEIVAHAAFYAGWPNAFSAVAVVGEVLRARGLAG